MGENGDFDSEAIELDIAIARNALADRDIRALCNAMKSMACHMPEEYIPKFGSHLLLGCADIFAESDPSLSWLREVARLMQYDPSNVLGKVMGTRLSCPRGYYSCIEDIQVAFTNVHEGITGRRSYVGFEDLLVSGIGTAIAAVHRRAAQFSDPEDWARRAAYWRWTITSEGPPPSEVDPPESRPEDVDDVAKALGPVLQWLDTVVATNASSGTSGCEVGDE